MPSQLISSRCAFLITKFYICRPDDGRCRQPKHVVPLNTGPIYYICMVVFVGKCNNLITNAGLMQLPSDVSVGQALAVPFFSCPILWLSHSLAVPFFSCPSLHPQVRQLDTEQETVSQTFIFFQHSLTFCKVIFRDSWLQSLQLTSTQHPAISYAQMQLY